MKLLKNQEKNPLFKHLNLKLKKTIKIKPPKLHNLSKKKYKTNKTNKTET
jgi:hypothetical protein